MAADHALLATFNKLGLNQARRAVNTRWLTGRALLFDRGQRHDGRVGVQEALEGGMAEPAVEFAIVDHSDKAWLDPPHPCR
jgi:hypothetical protein